MGVNIDFQVLQLSFTDRIHHRQPRFRKLSTSATSETTGPTPSTASESHYASIHVSIQPSASSSGSAGLVLFRRSSPAHWHTLEPLS